MPHSVNHTNACRESKKYRQTDNAEDREQYRKALNKATKTARKVNGDFEIKLAAEIKRDSNLRDMTGNLIDEPKLMAMLSAMHIRLISSKIIERTETYISNCSYISSLYYIKHFEM